MAERKESVRQIIPRGMVAGAGTSERLQGTIEWGGGTTAGSVTRPISRIEPLRSSPWVCERIQLLAQAGYSTAQLTAALAQEGCHSPPPGTPFRRQAVQELRRRLGVHQPRRRRRLPRSAPEWWLAD